MDSLVLQETFQGLWEHPQQAILYSDYSLKFEIIILIIIIKNFSLSKV